MRFWAKRIKYFFWSTMISGGLLVFGSQSSNFQKQFLSGVNAIKGKAYSLSRNGETMPKHLEFGFNSAEHIKPDHQGPVSLDAAPKILDINEDNDRRVSSSSNEYRDSSGNYVIINGKYYRARADNIYEVDGEKVYYVNNRKKEEHEKNAENESESIEKSLRAKLGSLPTSPSEAVEILKSAQDAAKKRNEYLDTIK